MTILNVGSINRDLIYRIDHLPKPGETLHSAPMETGLGGKGLNQSIALLRAGADVRHLGAVGASDDAMVDGIAAQGLATDAIIRVDAIQTGSAVILLDADAENAIILDTGANGKLSLDRVERAVAALPDGAWVLAQNETNATATALKAAKARGLTTVYSAAPFDADAAAALLSHTDILSVNEIEYGQLLETIGGSGHLPRGIALLVTLGARGAEYNLNGKIERVDAFKVQPVDTTGAGDTFLGFFVAAMMEGKAVVEALKLASAAAAIAVTRVGAAASIPSREEVEAFLSAD